MWQETPEGLFREFQFATFVDAFKFMSAVAEAAEQHGHHPKWENEYGLVRIWLKTHSAGDQITDKDHRLADTIDNIFNREEMPENVDKIATTPASPVVSETVQTELVQPDMKEIKMFADGGSRGNPGPSASGYVLLDMADNVIVKGGAYLGITTNNQAEYQAVKLGLEDARRRGYQEINVYLDSLLVVNQMKGIFKIRNRDLWPIHQAIKEIVTEFKRVTFTHVPRELNKLADGKVNDILDNTDKNPHD